MNNDYSYAPATAPPEATASAASPAPAPKHHDRSVDPNAKMVVVVDDNVDTAKPLARMLAHFGHRSAYFTSGEAALAFLRDQMADLILLDVMMPGMDGLEVLRNLRNDPKTSRMPVVLFSAVSDPEYRSHALSKGATDYWVKASLDFEELRYRVEKILRERPN